MKVKETTGLDINEVFDMNVVEFLNYLVYIKSWSNVELAINKEQHKRLKRQ